MSKKKSKSYYIVFCIKEFAKSQNMSLKDAYLYLSKYKGIEFLDEHYEAEHLLGFDEAVEDLLVICHREGGHLI
ncbi:MAG: DUF3791 domain-containing protein [Oscillospiraceae bacterium]|nr:DUF3791 domain-containing protein [Oscillospiraceae bacterium]